MDAGSDTLRATAFVAILLLMLAAERMVPKRRQRMPPWPRLGTNLGIVAIDTLAVRLLLPVTVVGAATWSEQQPWGLFNQVQAPFLVEFIFTILLLDLAIYGQHVAAHLLPWFWRIHRVHHADPQFDTTTGVRFHPVEILISTLYKISLVVGMGFDPLAVIAFEIMLNGTALFNHANLALPRRLDGILRLLIVTPDVHRVHHSRIPAETNSNYGFNLTLWDRLFHTWTPQPEKGHFDMDIGLTQYDDARPTRLGWCLKLPFVK